MSYNNNFFARYAPCFNSGKNIKEVTNHPLIDFWVLNYKMEAIPEPLSKKAKNLWLYGS